MDWYIYFEYKLYPLSIHRWEYILVYIQCMDLLGIQEDMYKVHYYILRLYHTEMDYMGPFLHQQQELVVLDSSSQTDHQCIHQGIDK